MNNTVEHPIVTRAYEAKRLYHTIKYMSRRQWVYRMRNTVLQSIPRRSVEKRVTDCRLIPYLYGENGGEKSSLTVADRVMRGELPTISEIYVPSINGEVDWDINGNDYRLICFRLNSFRYLLQLSDAFLHTRNPDYIKKGFWLIENWNNRCGGFIKGDKWNPYVIAERLMNWIGFYSVYSDSGNPAIISWIASQAIELKKMVEYQMGANHLLSEAKALMYVGVFLWDDQIYKYGKKILKNEFDRQFLDDGGNYERSISYHIEALQQYFEAAMLMHSIGDRDFDDFRNMLIKPYLFLNAMICSDGHIPLANDAALDYPFDAKDFLGTVEVLFGCLAPKAVQGSYSKRWDRVSASSVSIDWNVPFYHRDTGYLMEHYSINGQNFSIFFDAADIGADENPGHSHADSLNVLWYSDKPIIVDSGVFTYQPGRDRDFCRSTSAHNTIEVDGTDSSQVWAAFRCGKRARTKLEHYTNDDNRLEIAASHNGYLKVLKSPVSHTRRLVLEKMTGKWKIEDRLSGEKGHRHTASLRYHIHPDCKVEKLDDYTVLIDGKYHFQCSEAITVEECRVAEYFGIKRDGKCIQSNISFENMAEISSMIQMETESREIKKYG